MLQQFMAGFLQQIVSGWHFVNNQCVEFFFRLSVNVCAYDVANRRVQQGSHLHWKSGENEKGFAVREF